MTLVMMQNHIERMRRLVASGLLPERAGQPVRVWAHVSLSELRALDDRSVLQDQWIAEMTVRWAARRAAASQTGSDGAAWLDGRSARAVSCDATLIPVVTGQVDPGALDDLVNLCLQFAGHGPHCVGHGPHCGPPPAAGPGRVGQRRRTVGPVPVRDEEVLFAERTVVLLAQDSVGGDGTRRLRALVRRSRWWRPPVMANVTCGDQREISGLSPPRGPGWRSSRSGPSSPTRLSWPPSALSVPCTRTTRGG